MDLGTKQMLQFCNRNKVIKWLLTAFCYLIDQCSAKPSSETLPPDGNKYRHPQMHNVLRERDLEILSVKENVFNKSFPLDPVDEEAESVRASGDG